MITLALLGYTGQMSISLRIKIELWELGKIHSNKIAEGWGNQVPHHSYSVTLFCKNEEWKEWKGLKIEIQTCYLKEKSQIKYSSCNFHISLT